MKPIESANRHVANIASGTFKPFIGDDGKEDGDVLQVNGGNPGRGFHIYRMAPGHTTTPHVHEGDEEFFLIEGDLTDHDGYEYRPGDIVCLTAGTKHCSTTKNGCVLVVFFRTENGD